MSRHEWHFPMKCPECANDNGLPFRVQSKTSGEVMVSLRCGQCAHEWVLRRPTPLFAPKKAG